MFNPLHITGNDAFNAAIDQIQKQQTDERRHQENLSALHKANEISQKMLYEAIETNRKSKRANIISIVSASISLLSVVANVLVAIFV